MGTDIHGAVEVDWKHYHEDERWWRYAVDVGTLVGRDYETFASLFGVRGFADFEAIAPSRGLPDDAARRTKEENWGHSQTWIGYDEIQDIDWDESAQDNRFWVVDSDGEMKSKFSWGTVLEDMERSEIDAAESGELVEIGGDRYLTKKEITRKDALGNDWEWFLFDLLPTFSERYGNDSVRVVVWFDS